MIDKIKYIVFTLLVILGSKNSFAQQADFYAIDHVPEIRLYFEQANWDELLDSLYVVGSTARLGARVSIDGEMYEGVGVRYKGFSSYSATRTKNPFNIDLDYVFVDQHYQGYHKIKLSNVIQDPSFIRETLTYDVARKYMPASKANYANVYVNDTLIGLYTNVEAVNGDFLEPHFGSSQNTFVKCNPETVDLNGANSNLGDLGSSLDAYQTLYDMKSTGGNDWSNLYQFIDVLNNDQASIESVLNVDRALWMHAMNYAVINFDSYVGYAQNYYLYRDNNKQFNPILWDLNMSFGSFRLTDASDEWDGFTVEQAKTIDPLQHLNSFSVHPRPLIRNILQNDTYRRMYMAHIRTIIEENFENDWYKTRASYFHSIIDAHVQADTNKFYSYVDFTTNIDTTVSDLVEYPGIYDLMDDRSDYLLSYPGIMAAPSISNVTVLAPQGVSGEDITITAEVTSSMQDSVYIAFRFSESELFQWQVMYDDGVHNDGVAGDNIYGTEIENVSNLTQYYIYAQNDSAGRFSPERAAYEFHEHWSQIKENDVVFNEYMLDNTIESDELGESDAWIELYNSTDYAIELGALYLSDDKLDLTKWDIPSYSLLPHSYLTVWADGEVNQGNFHANFTAEIGDTLYVSYADGSIIDSVVLKENSEITSIGRYPNGEGDWIELFPTRNAENSGLSVKRITTPLYVYPNPANHVLNIKINNIENGTLRFISLEGKSVFEDYSFENEIVVTYDVSSISEGVYWIQCISEEENYTTRIILTH